MEKVVSEESISNIYNYPNKVLDNSTRTSIKRNKFTFVNLIKSYKNTLMVKQFHFTKRMLRSDLKQLLTEE